MCWDRLPVFVLQASARHASPCVAAPRVAEGETWWSQAGSNRRPLACHASALPAELWPRHLKALRVSSAENLIHTMGRAVSFHNHTSKPTSSLLIVGDVADDVGNIVVALFLVGDEGRVIVVIILDRLIDLDVVDRFRHLGLAVP
jgi:hypothetical protein